MSRDLKKNTWGAVRVHCKPTRTEFFKKPDKSWCTSRKSGYRVVILVLKSEEKV